MPPETPTMTPREKTPKTTPAAATRPFPLHDAEAQNQEREGRQEVP